jgi:hypothetical protein
VNGILTYLAKEEKEPEESNSKKRPAVKGPIGLFIDWPVVQRNFSVVKFLVSS